MIEVISATRLSEQDFWKSSALGISLRRLTHDRRLVPHIAFENRRGLPEIYNARITAPQGHDVLAFIHDDVWLDDYFLAEHVLHGLQHFEVVGIAGNRRRVPQQTAWPFLDTKFTWDARHNLSGSVAHGKQPFGRISCYGPVPAACELMDGVFLAARRSVLNAAQVQFDPRFDFHFYDLDFCRSARRAELRLGTWPISLTHQSGGAFGADHRKKLLADYLEKWPD